jgi:hypothetical protein
MDETVSQFTACWCIGCLRQASSAQASAAVTCHGAKSWLKKQMALTLHDEVWLKSKAAAQQHSSRVVLDGQQPGVEPPEEQDENH